MLDEGIERNLPGAGGCDAVAGHEAEHAEDVEHGLVDAVGGERAEALEVVLVFELKRPAQHGEQVDAVTVLQVRTGP